MKVLNLIACACVAGTLVTAALPASGSVSDGNPPGAENGNLYVSPASFFSGQDVTITANFPSGRFTVTLLKETEPGSGVFRDVARDESNSKGNAYFHGFRVEGETRVYAYMENNDVPGHTEIRTLQPEIVDPTGQPADGSLRADPKTYFSGQEVSIVANFPSGEFDVTLFEERIPGSGDYVAVGVDESNRQGNAYFHDYTVRGGRDLVALTDDGRYSEVRTLVPTVVDPAGHPSVGSLRSDPGSYFVGQDVKIAANFPSGEFLVTLFQETEPGSGEYKAVGTDESNSKGNAYFPGYRVQGEHKLVALTDEGHYSPVLPLDPKLIGELPNRATAWIETQPDPVVSGRQVTVLGEFESRCRGMRINFFRYPHTGESGDQFIGSDVANRYGDAYITHTFVYKEEWANSIYALTEAECISGFGIERTDFASVDFR